MKNKVIAISKQGSDPASIGSVANTAKNIQYLMRVKEVDAEELRQATGLGIATVNSLRRGEGNPTLSTLEVIAQFFQVSVSELIEANLAQGVAKNKSIKTMPLVNLRDLKKFIEEKFTSSEEYSTDIQDSGDKSYFAILVNNDTLSPQFPSGTTLVIGQDEEPCDGDFVLVQINSNTPCFRKLFIEGDHYLFSSILFRAGYRPIRVHRCKNYWRDTEINKNNLRAVSMNKFFKFLSWIKSVFNPPYELSLVDKTVNKKTGEHIYLFKQYQSHECFKLTFNDIVNNFSILQSINPLTLMEMRVNEYVAKSENDKFHIAESLRNNEYKIANKNNEECRSGSYICSNLDIYNNFNVHDLYKIVHTTGFKEGRDMSKKLEEVVSCHEKEEMLFTDYENVVALNKAR